MKKVILITVCITVLNLIGVLGVRSIPIREEPTSAFVPALRQNSKLIGGIWCWLDICPGKTLMADARQRILQSTLKLVKDYPAELQVGTGDAVYTFVTTSRVKPGFVDAIVVEPAQAVTLAESVLQFGTPISVQEEAEIGNSWHRAVCLQFGVCVMVHGFGPRVEMQSQAVSITFHGSNAQAYSYGYASWSGFTLLPPE